MTQINVCIADKQMHDKHIDQLFKIVQGNRKQVLYNLAAINVLKFCQAFSRLRMPSQRLEIESGHDPIASP